MGADTEGLTGKSCDTTQPENRNAERTANKDCMIFADDIIVSLVFSEDSCICRQLLLISLTKIEKMKMQKSP